MRYTLDAGAYAPERAHGTDAGADLRTPVAFSVPPYGAAVVDTGVHIELPAGTVGMIKSKSGLNVKRSIVTEGVIDEGYTGSIVCKLYNHSGERVAFQRGDKIAQLVVLPVLYVDFERVGELGETERGSNGFGSTGR